MTTIAIAGNPNCGKSALFNCLTGIRQTTGNWPGVTVERKTGRFNYEGRRLNSWICQAPIPSMSAKMPCP